MNSLQGRDPCGYNEVWGDTTMQTDTYLSELRTRGYRLTGKRREILDYLLSHNRYVSAKELIDYLKSKYPTMSFETVYRNLKTLRNEGMIEESRFDDESKFRIACQTGHHHHFICLRCGRTMVLEHCPMPDLEEIPAGFTVLKHRFEVLGYCKECLPSGKE